MASCLLVGDELAFVELRVLSLVAVDAIFNFVAEVPDKSLDGPCGSVTKGADGVSINLERELFEHIDLSKVSVSELHALEEIDHPASSLTAWSALSATLVLVELGEAENGVDDIGLFVHDDDGGGAETRLASLEVVEVHDGLRAVLVVHHLYGRTTGDDGLQVVPSTLDTSAVAVNQLSERNTHLLLNCAGVVDVTTDAE